MLVPEQNILSASELLRVGTGSGFTVIVPFAEGLPEHDPTVATVYEKTPDSVGVPLIVNKRKLYAPVTPAGRPVTVALVTPLARAYVIFFIGELMQTV